MSRPLLNTAKRFALLPSFLALPSCSLALDFDALTNGTGDNGVECAEKPCLVWSTPCHSVFVTSDEKYAYATHYQVKDATDPGLYRLDLSNVGASGKMLIKNDGLAAAAIAGNADWVIFSTSGASGKVYKVPSQQPEATVLWGNGFGDPFGVTLSTVAPAPTVYWADKTGAVRGVDGQGMALSSWEFTNKKPQYVAMHEGLLYTTVADTTSGMNQAQVLRLESNAMFTMIVDKIQLPSVRDIQGLAVASLKRIGDGNVVPHVFFVTSVGAGVAWETGDVKKPFDFLALASDKVFDKPGEITIDDQYVYWTMRLSTGAGGGVFRRPLADLVNGATETIGDQQQNPIGITLAGNSVYWCSLDGLYRRSR